MDQTLELQYAPGTFYFLVCGALVMWMAALFAVSVHWSLWTLFVGPSRAHPADPSGGGAAELEAAVLKAMAYEPRDRYQRVEDLQADIEAYLDGRRLQAASYGMARLACKARYLIVLLARADQADLGKTPVRREKCR